MSKKKTPATEAQAVDEKTPAKKPVVVVERYTLNASGRRRPVRANPPRG